MRSRPPVLQEECRSSRLCSSSPGPGPPRRILLREAYSAAAPAGARAEDEQLGQRVRAQPVGPVDAHAGDLAAAYSPASGVAPLMSVWTPPIM